MAGAVYPYALDPTGVDIHAETTRLREQGPIARVKLPGDVLAWSVHGYHVAKAIMADERFSKNPRRSWPAYMNGEISSGFPLITWAAMDNMATHDGIDHGRLRRLLLRAFTSHRVAAMRSHIVKTVEDLLQELDDACEPGGVVDLKKRFHGELPTRIMCDLFGVPAEARAEVLAGGHKNVDTTMTDDVAEANLDQWQKAIADLVDYKRANPGDDLTTGLIAAKDDDGSRLSDSEMIGTLHLLLGAGSETLVNALAHASLALLDDPDLREKVTTGQIPWDEVFEETLRVESPVGHLPFRFATEDIEIGGVTMAKGDVILVNFAGIGRDPEIHGETADTFDALRADKRHLSFGFGVHYCLGHVLAKHAWMIGIPALFERYPAMRLAVRRDELVGQGSFVVNGHASQPVYLKG
ncbi:cytochrome P450 family protein [Saccharothrix variisporea]|uniref:Cytochrome P450 n=1 Tax=Saccharothrix variisporea TaxID=543527 RepID=A0A495X8N3_9PSEU|nr:cytochrome P450 [Saccharothrix variisporea]RKT69224.1 cytochrome P450 [Saccharothrix variisporea]